MKGGKGTRDAALCFPLPQTSQLSGQLEPRHHQISVAADLWLSRLAQFTCRVGGRNKNFHGACRLALLPASALPLLRPLLSRSCPQYSIEQRGERRRCRPPSSSEDGVLLFSVPCLAPGSPGPPSRLGSRPVGFGQGPRRRFALSPVVSLNRAMQSLF